MFKRFGAALLSCLLLLSSVVFAADDDVSRLYNFTSGTTIQSSQVNAEFNQLVTTLNGKMSRTGVNTISGANTFSGAQTFSHGTTPILTDIIAERTAATGVTIDGTLLKDAGITASGTSTFSNATGVTTDTVTERTSNNGVSVDGLKIKDSYAAQKGFIRGCVVSWTDATSITISSTCAATDSTAADVIVPSGNLVVDMDNSNGALGRDTGAEASNTWYYVYLIKNPTSNAVSAVFSTTNEVVSGTITLPSGYTLKRQLPISVRNDGSSNLIDFKVANGWPNRPLIIYNVEYSFNPSGSSITVGPTNIVNNSSASSYTAATNPEYYIPPIARLAIFNINTGSGTWNGQIRETSGSIGFPASTPTGGSNAYTPPLPVSSAGSIDFKRNTGAASVFIDVVGFIVTEVP